jgi:hypothetical protein
MVAVGLALTPSSASAQSAGPTPPDQDAFYAQRPNAPAVPAGTVLDSRPVDLQGVTRSAYSSAYQLAYRTNDHNDKPITAITTVTSRRALHRRRSSCPTRPMRTA